MATALVIALATYLLLGIALAIRWHGFRGGVWVVVIVMTGFVWPLTLWALRLDEQRRIAREFRSALIELLHAERPTLEQRLAVEHARARARAILPRRVLAQATKEAFADARGTAPNEKEALAKAIKQFEIEPARRNRITVTKISNRDDE